jgi:hypothetical protein
MILLVKILIGVPILAIGIFLIITIFQRKV